MRRWVAGQIVPDIFKVKQSKKSLFDPEEDGDATISTRRNDTTSHPLRLQSCIHVR